MGEPVVLVRWRSHGLKLDAARAYTGITLTHRRFMTPTYMTVNIYGGNDHRCGQGSMLQRRWAWKR